MTAIAQSPKISATYLEEVISYNIRLLLNAKDLSQTALAQALGIKRSAMSLKINGKNSWSVPDLAKAAAFLNTTPEALMDDTLLRQQSEMLQRMGVGGAVEPRFFVAPFDGTGRNCAPARIRTKDPRLTGVTLVE